MFLFITMSYPLLSLLTFGKTLGRGLTAVISALVLVATPTEDKAWGNLESEYIAYDLHSEKSPARPMLFYSTNY